MEHLPLPRDVASTGPGSVPYVSSIEYDGMDFLTYPMRQGQASFLDAVRDSKIRNSKGMILMPLAELESFIQTWLFFGLLKEVLGDMSVHSHWVGRTSSSTNDPQWVVTTSKLVPVLNDWVNSIRSSEAAGKQAQYDHIAECLRMTWAVLQTIRYETRPDFNRQIRVSIASVAELLGDNANLAFGITDFMRDNKCPNTWQLLYDDIETVAQFKCQGYCPSEVHRILHTFLTIQTCHLLTWMTRNGSNGRTLHENCSESHCQANSRVLKQRASRHLDAACNCTDLSVDISDVISILSRGSLPLLRMSAGATIRDIHMDVVDALPNIKYVAISHVWADGLGNPDSNSLPVCQLRRLHDLVASLNGPVESNDVFIWLDTLCCPVEPPEAKRLALSQMHRPYTDAVRVLVLDSSLRDVESSRLHPTEICLRALTSGWMRRLWTLQEGALARNLWFQYSDVAVNFKQMWFELLKIYTSDLGRRGLVLDAMCVYQGLRIFNGSETVLHGASLFPDLSAVDYALRHRAVSVATDEPLLIGGLLKLDLAHILDGPESSRMQRLWSLVPSVERGIPKSVLFRKSPRLCQPGFRWAPATFLTFQDIRNSELQTRAEDDETVLTPAGLRVRLAALPVTIPPTARGLPKLPWGPFDNGVYHCIYCRYESGTWVFINPAHAVRKVPREDAGMVTLRASLLDSSKRHTLLLATPFKFDHSVEVDRALLVHGSHNWTGVPEVSSDLILNIGTKVGSMGVLLESAYQASQILLADEITEKFVRMAIEDESEQKRDPVYQDLVASLAEKLRIIAENVDDVEVHEAIQLNNRHGNAMQLYQSLVANAYVGNCGRLGQMMPSDTEWCVD